MSRGAAVSCLGHSDRAVTEAIGRQLEKLPFAHTSFFTNEPKAESFQHHAIEIVDSPKVPIRRAHSTN